MLAAVRRLAQAAVTPRGQMPPPECCLATHALLPRKHARIATAADGSVQVRWPAAYKAPGNSRKEKPPPLPVRVDQDRAPGGDLLQPALCERSSNSRKEKPPPLPVRVVHNKAPGGDLLLHGKATLPSAHARFTSEFGMGSGGTTPLWPPGKGWEQRVSAGSTFLKSPPWMAGF